MYGDEQEQKKNSGGTKEEAPSFLCFQRRTTGDLVKSGYKIGGSAQRRLNRSLLQHGSVLLRKSDKAPELPGIYELSQEGPLRGANPLDEGFEMLAERLAAQIFDGLGAESVDYDWSKEELDAATNWVLRKFASEAWLWRK